MRKKNDPLDYLYWRDEILQIAYWFQGEGFGTDFRSADLRRFLPADAPALELYFAQMMREGLLDEPARGKFRLTKFGHKEGGRRFQDVFSEMTKPAHGECSADCDCHSTGNIANCTNRGGGHAHAH